MRAEKPTSRRGGSEREKKGTSQGKRRGCVEDKGVGNFKEQVVLPKYYQLVFAEHLLRASTVLSTLYASFHSIISAV